ncbi:glycosyltransferase [Aquiflexum sp. LQ15W]|uniref:glycosyltransferase family 4 protein n=1 Tax=Cognataquiflexum nitidum TaxID=2922272 RepID=UPI001F12AC7E|nr:glycosyltransferase [Cognataquiflexum nitidum]MCH6201333.1 glycosyltransferase [Cognataquiflexum nitidum]
MDKRKKKVLLFIDWFLPGNKAGGPVTSNVNIIDHLRDEIDFYIVTRNSDYCEDTPYTSVPSDQWTDYRNGVSVFYFSKKYLTVANLKKVAFEANCEHWYINGAYSLYFSILPLLLARLAKGVRTTVASRGMLSPHAMAEKPMKKKIMMGVFRAVGFYRNIDFHASNVAEATDIIKQVGRNKNIFIAPNLPKKRVSEPKKKVAKMPGDLKLFSIARISPEKNTLGAIEMLGKCTQHSIQFDLYGQLYDHDYMRKCTEEVQKLPNNISVNFHGSISPQDVMGVMDNSHFLYLPTHGENFGHAILESLSAACPVIISDSTPWRGLREKGIGWDIPLNQPYQFVRAIETAVSMDQETYDKMSQAALSFAKEFAADPEVLESNRKLFGLGPLNAEGPNPEP